MIKCVHGHNHYGLKDEMINDNVVKAKCPRCEQVDTWDHLVKCSEKRCLRKVFMQDLVVTLVKNKPEDVNEDAIISFVEDILKCIENEEKEEYETNQQYVGMKELFRGYVVIDWEGRKLQKICKVSYDILERKEQ